MTARSILMVLAVMLLVSIAGAGAGAGAVALALYARSDDGASALERLERSNPAWEGIGRYQTPVPADPVRE